ncbi:MAG: ABC transporter ATP-binding protein [Phycisphaerales bacterium]|nr:MAG: ABC transporter ATP-binding protein [Phycisphaerales bacterium]
MSNTLIQRILAGGLRPPASDRYVPPGADEDEPRYRPIDLALIRRMLSWLKPYRRRYALGISLGVVMVLLEMTSPLFMRAIIDHTTAFATGHGGGASPLTPTLPDAAASSRSESPAPSLPDSLTRGGGEAARQAFVDVSKIIAFWGVVLAAAILLQRATILVMTSAGERVQFDLRRSLFAHLQQLSMSYYDRTRLGWIISRCTSDLSGLREMNVWGIDTVVKNTLIMLAAGFMLLSTEPRLFLALVWMAPLLFWVNRFFKRKLSAAWQVAREGFTRVSTNLAENITGVRVVTAFARQSWNLRRFNVLQEANTYNNVRAAGLNGVYQPTLQLFGFTGRAIILLYGGYLVTTGRVAGVGSIVAAFLYWDLFMGPILTFGNFHNQLMQAMAGAERIVNLLDTKPQIVDAADAIELPPLRGHVRFENVTFGYDSARPVLHDVSLEARPGETIALVGPTGSGKSSIISLIARFYQPQQGRILVDGYDIRRVAGDSLHRQMGLVLQVNYLFSGTVMDNIRYARPAACDEEVIEATRALGSYEAIMRLSDGFSTDVGERGANLSLGQRQLVCFSRAFLADPRIFLLDEATSSIDSVTERLVQRSLERLVAGRTTFIVAHRLSTITRADCILFVEQGRLAERGPHDILLQANGKYAALYREFAAAAG